MYRLWKKGGMKCNGTKFCSQGDTKFKQISDGKGEKENGDLRARLHAAKLSSCEKELKKS